MELWFWSALFGAVFAGFSNFCFKIAAKRKYDAELFTLVGGATSVIAVTGFILIVGAELGGYGWLATITVAAGAVASLGGIMKVYALHFIDTTIFFPLFKLLSPLIALLIGITWYQEAYTVHEWLGLLLGLSVPLLLINKIENSRQVHLFYGLIFVVLVSLTSASAAALNKFVIDLSMPVPVALWYASVGVSLGSFLTVLYKRRSSLKLGVMREQISIGFLTYAVLRALLICLSLGFILFAYIEGALGVVQTIQSLYILIPIVLSIIFYSEHWNVQKMVAAIISVAALALLG